jgi:hypothetical protein
MLLNLFIAKWGAAQYLGIKKIDYAQYLGI